MATMACQLKILSTETRLQIFGYLPSLVSEPWNGKMPAIIKALRSDRELQQEAVSVFAKHQVYVMYVGNSWSFQDMLSSAILTIKNVRIVIDVDIKPCKGIDWNARAIFEPAGSMCISLLDLQASARRLPNVKSLDIEFNTAWPSWVRQRRIRGRIRHPKKEAILNEYDLHSWAHQNYFRLAAGFKDLDRVSVILPPYPHEQHGDGRYGVQPLNDIYNNRAICAEIEAGNTAFGVSAKLDRVTEITSMMKDLDQYVWLAGKDKHLNKQIARDDVPLSHGRRG